MSRSCQDTTRVFSVLLVVVLKLITLFIILNIMPNKLASLLILVLPVTTWMKPSDFPANEALPSYQGPTPEGITAALELLQGRLALCVMFQSLPTADLREDLQQLMNIQQAIVNVLRLVEGTALEVMHIFIDREVEWEQMHKDLLSQQVNEVVEEVVDTGHGVDDGECFDFDGNLDS